MRKTPSEDLVFRLRAKMDDNSHKVVKEGGVSILAFRVEGESIELLESLEYLSEFIKDEDLEGTEKLLIISDRNYEVTPASVLGPKMETKKEDDERLFNELQEKLKERLEPIVFTVENDVLELYRIAMRLDGSMGRTDESIGLDLLKVDLPKEGDVIYLIFEDGYRKMDRPGFRSIVDNAMEGLREGPNLARDSTGPSMNRSKRTGSAAANGPANDMTDKGGTQGSKIEDALSGSGSLDPGDPKLLMRDFSKKAASLGYRKDTVFSRPDVKQMFFVGMKGPALLFKILESKDEIGSFLRILEHRKDSLGILISREWDPEMEALSRVHGFIYLDNVRGKRAIEVVRAVIREEGH